MPNNRRYTDDELFGQRLLAVIRDAGHVRGRRGAGAYLAKRYKVSTVTANAWLNGDHRPDVWVVFRIAKDHGVLFDELYFGESASERWPFKFAYERFDRLSPGQKIALEGKLLGEIVDIEQARATKTKGGGNAA